MQLSIIALHTLWIFSESMTSKTIPTAWSIYTPVLNVDNGTVAPLQFRQVRRQLGYAMYW